MYTFVPQYVNIFSAYISPSFIVCQQSTIQMYTYVQNLSTYPACQVSVIISRELHASLTEVKSQLTFRVHEVTAHHSLFS